MQRTLAREGSVSGIGIHTGESSTVCFKPAPVDTGVRFFKNGLSFFAEASEDTRCTSVGSGRERILTVEHLLAALAGLRISNVFVEVEGPEIPILDGSALPFVRLFRELGIVGQGKPRDVYRIAEPLFCFDRERALGVYPAETFQVAYVLDYGRPPFQGQIVDFTLTAEVFESAIAPARTFCTAAEADGLRAGGFGKGANFENTLVVSEKGPLHNAFRFDDECARHKVLDLLGDLSLLGFSILGRVVGLRSGHSLNRKLVCEIRKQREGLSK